MTKTNTTHGIDLQLFADAGSLVNGTAGFVNASTGVTGAFDTTNTLAPELKSFYDTELLENARAEMVYAQFAKRQPLPANHHGAVEWRKWNSFDRASKLTEGVIPTGQKPFQTVIAVLTVIYRILQSTIGKGIQAHLPDRLLPQFRQNMGNII